MKRLRIEEKKPSAFYVMDSRPGAPCRVHFGSGQLAGEAFIYNLQAGSRIHLLQGDFFPDKPFNKVGAGIARRYYPGDNFVRRHCFFILGVINQ